LKNTTVLLNILCTIGDKVMRKIDVKLSVAFDNK